MIPKRIYYCWFGKGKLTPLYNECILSWRKQMPEYEIIEVNETNCDLSSPLLKSFIAKKQWAFVSDYIRLKFLYENGGLYFDTDVEVVKSFDPLLETPCFIGYESKNRPNTAVIGSEKGHPFLKLCIDMIEERFEKGLPYKIAPEVATLCYEEYLSKFDPNTIKVFDSDFFYPFNPYDCDRKINVLMAKDITSNTFAIHHWGKGWDLSLFEKIRRKIFK